MKLRIGKGDPADTVIPVGLWIADILLILVTVLCLFGVFSVGVIPASRPTPARRSSKLRRLTCAREPPPRRSSPSSDCSL